MLYMISAFGIAIFFGVSTVVVYGPLNLPEWISPVFWSIIGAGAILRVLEILRDALCRLRKRRHKPCWPVPRSHRQT